MTMIKHKIQRIIATVALCSVASSCIAATNTDNKTLEEMRQFLPIEGSFKVHPETRICTYVGVYNDMALSTRYDTPQTNHSISISQLLREHYKGLFDFSEDEHLKQKPYWQRMNGFHPVNNYNKNCENNGINILIAGQYSPRDDGGPFQARYIITQGSFVKTATYQIDLNEEFRSGKRVTLAEADNVMEAFTEDTKTQGKLILDQITGLSEEKIT